MDYHIFLRTIHVGADVSDVVGGVRAFVFMLVGIFFGCHLFWPVNIVHIVYAGMKMDEMTQIFVQFAVGANDTDIKAKEMKMMNDNNNNNSNNNNNKNT